MNGTQIFAYIACVLLVAVHAQIPISLGREKLIPDLIGIGGGVGGSLATAGGLALTATKWADLLSGVRIGQIERALPILAGSLPPLTDKTPMYVQPPIKTIYVTRVMDKSKTIG